MEMVAYINEAGMKLIKNNIYLCKTNKKQQNINKNQICDDQFKEEKNPFQFFLENKYSLY